MGLKRGGKERGDKERFASASKVSKISPLMLMSHVQCADSVPSAHKRKCASQLCGNRYNRGQRRKDGYGGNSMGREGD